MKKLGDYTLNEIKKICEVRHKRKHPWCIECPFYNICQLVPDEMAQYDLDMEVEEDDKKD